MMLVVLLITCLALWQQPALARTAAVRSAQNETSIAETNGTLLEVTTTSEVVTLPDEDEPGEIQDTDTAPSVLSDDVIELNVGGQKMTTLRSTLTVVPESKLAQMFSKDYPESKLHRDKQGAVFFDYSPIYFNFLLDQLRAIKRLPQKPGYQLQFQAPYANSQMNFTHMLVDLGLTPDDFLLPREGAHVNLTVSSLAGWQECYRSAYNVPFDLSVLNASCNGSRLLVACRSVRHKNVLTLAAIGQFEDVLHPCLPKDCKTNGNGKSKKKNKKVACSSSHQCITQTKRGVGWYNVNNQTWGFVRGSLSFVVNPCDSSDLDSDYRLCWTNRAEKKSDHGDRCGSAKNLQNSAQWERLIYSIA